MDAVKSSHDIIINFPNHLPWVSKFDRKLENVWNIVERCAWYDTVMWRSIHASHRVSWVLALRGQPLIIWGEGVVKNAKKKQNKKNFRTLLRKTSVHGNPNYAAHRWLVVDPQVLQKSRKFFLSEGPLGGCGLESLEALLAWHTTIIIIRLWIVELRKKGKHCHVDKPPTPTLAVITPLFCLWEAASCRHADTHTTHR